VSSTVGSSTNTGMEAAGKGRITFDIFAILIQRRGAHAVQLAARQCRFEQVGRIHGPVGLARADQRVHLVDEQDDGRLGRWTSFKTALRRSSNSPRYFAPAISAPMSSAISFLSFRLSGTSPLTMRSARPSAMAVLPTPGSPIRTGLFLVRRDRTWIVRRISSSRPMTGRACRRAHPRSGRGHIS
jgi:hypothetical protein